MYASIISPFGVTDGGINACLESVWSFCARSIGSYNWATSISHKKDGRGRSGRSANDKSSSFRICTVEGCSPNRKDSDMYYIVSGLAGV